MSELSILVVLREIEAKDLEIGVSHEPLQREDIHAIPKHVESKSSAKIVQGWFSAEFC